MGLWLLLVRLVRLPLQLVAHNSVVEDTLATDVKIMMDQHLMSK